jgi:hypothetical protein
MANTRALGSTAWRVADWTALGKAAWATRVWAWLRHWTCARVKMAP